MLFFVLLRIEYLYHDGKTHRIQWPIYTLENIDQFCIFQHFFKGLHDLAQGLLLLWQWQIMLNFYAKIFCHIKELWLATTHEKQFQARLSQ